MSDSDFETLVKRSHRTFCGNAPSSSCPVNIKSTAKKSRREKTVKNTAVGNAPISTPDAEYMITQIKRFGSKVQNFNQMDIVEELNTTLTKKQKKLFQSTPFGHFLSMHTLFFQAQLIHHILLREVYSMKEEEFWFKINGNLVRYSIEEFCLVTGLKCHGDEDISKFILKDGGLKEIIFPKRSDKITKKELRQAFIEKKAVGDWNMVKLGLVHLLANFLFGTVSDTKVNNMYWAIVDSDESLVNNFAFGKILWELSRNSIRKALHDKEKFFDKKFDEKTGKIETFSYKLLGFPIAFQVWIYESIPKLSPIFCERISEGFPKITCWKSLRTSCYTTFTKKFFSTHQLEVIQMLPSKSDKEKAIIKAFSFKPKFMYRKATSNESFEVPMADTPICTPVSSASKPKGSKLVQNNVSYDSQFKKIDRTMKEILSNQKNIYGELCTFNQNFEQVMKTLGVITSSLTSSKTTRKENSAPYNDVAYDKETREDCHLSDGILNIISKENPTDNAEDQIIIDLVLFEPKDDVEALHKREHKPSATLKSPFLTEFGSSEIEAAGKRKIDQVGIVKGVIPFDKQLGMNITAADTSDYSNWFNHGFKPKTKLKFSKDAKQINFDFGITTIEDKLWFYQLQTCGQFWTDGHIDVCMYYLRKKIRHSGNVKIRVCTTDSLFFETARSIYQRCPLSNYNSVVSFENLMGEYILGTYMCCSTPWALCDHVLMPVHVKEDCHFVLVHFNIKERSLIIYNSLKAKKHMNLAMKSVEAFSVLIPLYLEKTGFYDARQDLDFIEGPYSVPRSDPLKVVVAEGVPQQDDCDCGAFVVAFADHIIHESINNLCGKINIANYRDELAVCLSKHAMKKQVEGYQTDNEKPKRLKKKHKI